MTRIIYEIVEHDGGWAYKVGDVFSEPFPSHDGPQSSGARSARTGSPGRVDGLFIRGQG